MKKLPKQKPKKKAVAKAAAASRPVAPVGNSILLAADIESGDAPALSKSSVT
jgi:hypothetical protein